jgi:hypothetical protein
MNTELQELLDSMNEAEQYDILKLLKNLKSIKYGELVVSIRRGIITTVVQSKMFLFNKLSAPNETE